MRHFPKPILRQSKRQTSRLAWGSAALSLAVALSATPLAQAANTTGTWAGGSTGNWSVAGNWTTSDGATLPPNTSTTDAVINSASSTVTLDNNFSVGNLTLGGTDNLNFNLGIQLLVAGDITNAGHILLNGGGGSNTFLQTNAATVTLQGGGTVTLSSTAAGGDNAIIQQAASSQTLTNANNTIQGEGMIGNGGLTLINQSSGTINANSAGGTLATLLLMNNTGGTTNAGLMEATNSGVLQIAGITVNNSGGNITANGASATVQLTGNTTIQGGTLNTLNGGTLGTGQNQNVFLDGTTHGALVIKGTYTGAPNSATYLTGTITNNGTIQLNGGNGSNSVLLTNAAAVTLQGGGTVTMSSIAAFGDNAIIEQNGSSQTLTNVNNTIQGEGIIGNGGLTLINQSSGTINANSAGGTLSTLLLMNNGGGTTNAGLMEATNSGVLQIAGITVNNSGGNITANGASATVQLTGNTTIQGGTLNALNGGTLGAGQNQNAFLDGDTHGAIVIHGTYTGAPNSATYLTGTITNNDNIQLNGGNAVNTDLLTNAAAVTLQGGGTVTMSTIAAGGNNAIIEQANSSQTLTNVDNTIQGEGIIGNGGLTLINQATVNANSAGGTLATVLLMNNSGGTTNSGLMEATNHGVLQIAGTTVNNLGGNITANGANAAVQFTNSTVIQGGTLNTLNSGTLGAADNSIAYLDGSTVAGAVTINGTYTSDFNTYTYLRGTITNKGNIQVNGGNAVNTVLWTDSANVTLQGGGTVTLSTAAGGSNAIIAQNAGSQTLTNVNNTIQGEGIIGNGGLTVVNQATINANSTGGSLPTLLLMNGGGITNSGLMKATDHGVLQISGVTVNNAGGNITADGANAAVQFVGNAVIQGGTLNTLNGATLGVTNASIAYLDGSTAAGAVTINGTYTSDFNTFTYLRGTIANKGNIQINGGNGVNTILWTDSTNVTLQGGGTVTLATTAAGGASAYIQQNAGGQTLTNVDNTIAGNGFFGNSGLTIVNQAGGTIAATTATGQRSVLSINATGGISNLGTLQADSGAIMDVSSDLVQDDATTAGVLTAGTYKVLAGSTLAIAAPGTQHLTQIAADAIVILSGTNSIFTSGGGQIDATLTTNSGELHVLNRTFAAQAFTNSGLLQLGGGGSLPTGGGVFTAPSLINYGTIEATGAGNVLTVTAGITDPIAAKIIIDAGGSLDISAGGVNNSAVTLAHSGTNLKIGANNITVSGDYTNPNFDTTAGNPNTFNKHANVTGTGKILAAPGSANMALISVTGAGVSNGGTAMPSINGINAHVGVASTYNFQLNNTGTAGTNPTIRGAIKNTGITDTQLSVTAADYVVAPAGSTTFSVTFTPTAIGNFAAGQTIHVANNFDNVTEQDVSLGGAAYALASTNFNTTTVTLSPIRIGGTFASQSLTVGNTLAANTFNETLGAQFANATGVTISGSPITVVAGAPANTAMTVSLPGSDTTSVGVKSGTVDVQFDSKAVNNSGLGTTSLAALNKTVTVSGTVYRVASVNSLATPISLGIIHPNDSFGTQALAITNTAASDGFSEGLDAAVTGTTPGATSSGSITNLAANTSSATGNQITVGLGAANTSTVGAKTGTVTVGFSTDGLTTSGLTAAPLTGATQTVTLNGQVNDYAAPAFHKTAGDGTLSNDNTPATTYTLDFGTKTAPATGSASLSLANILAGSDVSFQDSLAGTFTVQSGAGAFQLTGFANISDANAIAADDSASAGTVSFSNLGPGTYTETVLFTPVSTTNGLSPDASIPSDPSGVSLTITVDVQNPVGVPEPASLAVLSLGAAALLTRRRR